MLYTTDHDEVMLLKDRIKQGTALYYYRSTPFTEHSEFNYNGVLKEKFFFENMFSNVGMCSEYIELIKNSLTNHEHKSILLIGNQGCGKTTFVHYLSRKYEKSDFLFFDFDKDTSNPTLAEYIEKFSSYLLELLKSDDVTNKILNDLYIRNKKLINEKINGNNNINQFFKNFKNIFIDEEHRTKDEGKEEFIKNINNLFFNQILSLIILWKICKFKKSHIEQKEVKPIVFCLDNLDVLVNKEIVEKFFKEYFLFVRNVDSIIQQIDDEFFNKIEINYNQLFAFVFCCRKHTWARVREHYRHSNTFVRISTLELDITDAFDKKEILSRREKYISDNIDFYNEFKDDVSTMKALLFDMDTQEGRSHNIYDLFDDDYRQCNITFDEIIRNNPDIINKYFMVKNNSPGINGARGIIYKAIFEKFKSDGIFKDIGVLDVDSVDSLVSNARILLNYLNYQTYTEKRNGQKHVSFDKIVSDFRGIISRDEIDKSLIAMFKLGDDSYWNELVAFVEIHSNDIKTCEGLEVFITKAGHEYLNWIATHFEFFNTRVVARRKINAALFDEINILSSQNEEYIYNFEETISNVKEIVENCCRNMSQYYKDYMLTRYNDKYKYLKSFFVYGDAKVLHGERIIHTHIRYVDQYRLYILRNVDDSFNKKEINEILVKYIEDYMRIGEEYPDVLTKKSTEELFPAFKEKIKIIRKSKFEDYTTKIDM